MGAGDRGDRRRGPGGADAAGWLGYTLVDTYCRDPRASVRYTRDHGSEHIVGEVVGGPAGLLWMRDRLTGVPAEPGCAVTDTPTMLGTPGELPFLASVFGETIASFFGKPIGVR